MSHHEHESPEDAARWLADYYSRPRKPRITDTQPLPVTGPAYSGGAMVPIEYQRAEGSSLSGREMVRHVVRRSHSRYVAAMATPPRPVQTIAPVMRQQPAPINPPPTIPRPHVMSATELLILAVCMMGAAALCGWMAVAMARLIGGGA